MNRLVVTTTPDSSSLLSCLNSFPGTPFSWAYLGQSIGDFRRIQRCFEGQGNYLDTTERFHQAAEDLREPYLIYLYQMGRKLNSLNWWITSLSHRNGHTSKTFHQACYLRVALGLAQNIKANQTLVLVSDLPVLRALKDNLAEDKSVEVRGTGTQRNPGLRLIKDVLRMLAHRAFFVFREGGRIVRSRSIISDPYIPSTDTTVLVSWMTPGNFDQGEEFHRSFFGDLAEKLGQLGCRIAISPIILRQVQYGKALQRLKDWSLPVIVPHRYLSVFSFVRLVVASTHRPPRPRIIPALCGMEIKELVEEDLRVHWISNGGADAMLMASVVRRWAELKMAITRIIYIFENQPYERAICWEARRSLPGATIVGYQHARVAPLILQVNLAPGGEADAPLPDWLVTVGKHTSRLLEFSGHTPESLREGGALQMQRLMARRSNGREFPDPGDQPTILVATASMEEAAELVDLAARLFSEEEGVNIILKFNPAFLFNEVEGWPTDQLPNHISVSNLPITDLMLKSSLMVYAGSTVCVEALALGLPSIHLRTQFDLDIDALGAVPHLRMEASGITDLREKVEWLLQHRQEYIAQHQEQWGKFVYEMYGAVTDKTYRAFL